MKLRLIGLLIFIISMTILCLSFDSKGVEGFVGGTLSALLFTISTLLVCEG
jgi:hypothetical protein